MSRTEGKVYLVVHKETSSDETGLMSYGPSLEKAKRIPKPKVDPAQGYSDAPSGNAFVNLLNNVSDAIDVYRSLDETTKLLSASARPFQVQLSLLPVLQEYATVAYDASDRKIYTFHRTHLPEIERAMTQASRGIIGLRQLPRLLLMGLVGEYDMFLNKLIRAGAAAQPKIMAGSEKSIKLKELLNFSSIAEATEHLLEREIESIMYEDHLDSLSAVGKLFNVKIELKDETVQSFLEICERRNLLTHNTGIVNSKYIRKCNEFNVHTTGLVIGQQLEVSHEYYKKAVSIVHEMCIKLCQFIWRKLKPDERELADLELNETASTLIAIGDYELAEHILNYGIYHTGKGKEDQHRLMVINYANAIKLSGDKSRALAELDHLDWSATDLIFRIAVAAIRSDLTTVLELMPVAVKANELGADAFRRSPVFTALREEKSFQEKFRDLFDEELIIAPGIATAITNGNRGLSVSGAKLRRRRKKSGRQVDH